MPGRRAASPSATRSPGRYHVPNLERALHLLEFLAVEPAGMGISDLARRLELPKNSVFRIVSTLHAHGYLVRDSSGRTFALGRKLLALGYAAVGEHHLVEKALDVMRDLRDRTGETVLLGTLLETTGVVLEQVQSLQPVRFVVDVGHRFPLHTAAPGKAMLAFLPEAEREALLPRLPLKRFTARTITDPDALCAEWATVRRRGYAYDRGEEIDGLHCVAAPIFNHRGQPVAALWVTGPAYRLKTAALTRAGAAVRDAALTVSGRFGYQVLADAAAGKGDR